MPLHKTSTGVKFQGDELDTMIGVAMIEHAGRDAYARNYPLSANPHTGEAAWAWGMGWRMAYHMELNGAGIPTREAVRA